MDFAIETAIKFGHSSQNREINKSRNSMLDLTVDNRGLKIAA